MTALFLLLAGQAGIARQPVPDQVMIKCQFVTFESKVDWKNLPGRAEIIKDTRSGLPFEARIVKMDGDAFASSIYERLGQTPTFKVISSPIVRTLMGHKATISQGSDDSAHSIVFQTGPDPKEAGTYNLTVQYDNAAHPANAAEPKPYPFTFTTKFAPRQTLILAIKPNEAKEVSSTVQMITVQWLGADQIPGGG